MPYQPRTHVANGSRHVIRVKAGEDASNMLTASRVEISMPLPPGYTAIAPGHVFGFPVGAINGPNRNVFLSVYYEDSGYLYRITTGLQVSANGSIIITRENTVVNTRMGELWIEEHNGRNHEPSR